MQISENTLQKLSNSLDGKLFFDNLHKTLYATDASVYRKIPLAVAYPKTIEDLKKLIVFASENHTTLIPRTAGTSLAGQCVGDGIVVDVSKYFTNIISLDKQAKTVTLQPAIIRDDLNRYLKPFNLFFGPNTSTSNRCMIGGMVGNNSSGTTSIKYGVTRDKVVSLKTILSDGSEAVFSEISSEAFIQKTKLNSLEGQIYKRLYDELSQTATQKKIHQEFPDKAIHRRNTGYAIDELLKSNLFGGTQPTINLAEFLCGSEGTLAFTTEITLQLDAIPPSESVMVCAHFNSIDESLKAVVTAMQHNLYVCEMMDKTVLDCTKNNREHQKNRFFIQDDPQAILMLECKDVSLSEAKKTANNLIADLKANNFGYAFPILEGNEIKQALDLRKAGLGLLGNIVGDKKAVACIEDTAVKVEDLPNYIAEFTQIMDKYQQKAVYYAHAGAGELHLRPILNLKKQEDVVLFKKITTETAELVKKYNGSFSGEHGDGIVRAEFIPLMIGEENYALLKRIKHTFDPKNVFNKGKIVDAFAMDESLRYEVDRIEPKIDTLFNFDDSQGILRSAEKCNGSGDCRKSVEAGGTMCPSYRATKNEKDTTRARANTLREILTNNEQKNRFNSEELKEVFDLCLSCKACASECPSNVDIATLKAEFLHQYYKSNKPTFASKMFAKNVQYNKLGSRFPTLTNTVLNTRVAKSLFGIAQQRSVPKLHKTTLRKWYNKHKAQFTKGSKKVYLFCDEFINYYDVTIGMDAVKLLSKLDYNVQIVNHEESGRSAISKGFLEHAKAVCNKNVAIFKDLIDENSVLIGVEPSAILSFKDEYLRMADDVESAKKIAKNTFIIDEFIAREFKNGRVEASSFSEVNKNIKIHVHCHQKALSSTQFTFEMLNIPSNFKPTLINSGCCGMAGSFGYEKQHFDVSMRVGEDSLLPKVRKTDANTEIVATGTSCRHQIFDGTKRVAKHPVTLLLEALR